MALITPKINASSITAGTVANARLSSSAIAGTGPYEFINRKNLGQQIGTT